MIEKIDLDNNIEEKKKSHFWRKKKFWLVILVVLIIVVFATILPALIVVNKAKTSYRQAMVLKEVVKTKDLKKIKQEIISTKQQLSLLNQSLNLFIILRPLPIVGSYISDASHLLRAGEAGLDTAELVVKSIEPYADLIGFSGGANTGEKTAADRISFIVTTLDKIRPDIEKVDEKIQIAKKELDQVNPGRYPTEFQGKKIRDLLTELITLVDQVAILTHDAKPMLEQAPWLLGVDAPRRYLIVFQNDAELRPTGGFMTAYAIIEVDKGKLKPILSEDIYDLDSRLSLKDRAPDALISYVPFPYSKDSKWRLRDMNISPDFKISMEQFTKGFKQASSQKFDGVVAVDTQVLVRLLKVLGRIGVPGWGNFSAEPDKRCFGCPLVVYELEVLADKPVNMQKTARKAVIGPLMHSILANAFGSPKEKVPGLFEAGYSSVMEKHVLFYFPDQRVQSAMEGFNIAGRVREFDGDYFFLVDSSFSGAKTNLFLKQSVTQKIEVQNGKMIKTVTVDYKNPSPASNCNLEAGQLCLNAPYRDWFRLYVPKGSRLIESSGSEVEVKTYDELGKTVFEGFFGDKYPLRPQGTAKLTFKYELPILEKSQYKLLIQKQPGTTGHEYTVEAGGQKQEFILTTDKELRVKI